MFVEPIFLLLAGFATVAFVSAAFLGFIRNDPSALFFTLAAGATSFLLFVQLPQNVPGADFYNYGTPRAGAAQYGTPKMVQVIQDVAKQWKAMGGPSLGVGNMSLENGGHFPPHDDKGGHTDGSGADIRPVRKDGRSTGVSYNDPAYDRQGTQRLVDKLEEWQP